MNTDQMKILEQIIIEDEFSRKNVREKVVEDITGDLKAGLYDSFTRCQVAIEGYLNKQYFKSKDNRVQCIRHIPIQDIATEVLIAVLSIKGIASIQGVAAKLGNWLEYEDVFDGAHTGAELLGACVDTGAYDIIAAAHSESGYLSVKPLGSLDQETIDFIEKTRYLNPMLIEPKPWFNNSNGGYISFNESVLLGKGTHHEEPQNLKILNMLQEVEFSLDSEVLKALETSKKPLDTPEKMRAHADMVRVSKLVYEELVSQGNSFHFVWKYDFRGRMYSSGYYVNLQGASYKKALLNFKKKVMIK